MKKIKVLVFFCISLSVSIAMQAAEMAQDGAGAFLVVSGRRAGVGQVQTFSINADGALKNLDDLRSCEIGTVIF